MITQLLTGEDTRFLAQQPEYETDIMVGQMTTLMQNITDLQSDTDDKVAQLQNQSWFKRMTNTLFGKNKVTKQEIQKNNDKVVTYISQSVAQLYNMNLINERAICSLGNRMNEVYMQVVESNQEMLNMKGQISQIMAVQQQTMEALGAFVNKLNEKIESVDNFHMLISEIQNGMYNDSSKLYNLCSILSQLDKRQMNDNRKMNLLIDTMNKSGIITSDEITVLKCLQEIVALPQEKIGLIYLELCNFRNSFPADLFADMIENYHFLSKMEKMSKKKEVIIQRVIDKYDLDSNAPFSIEDISKSFFENKQACLVDISNIQISMNDSKSIDSNKKIENIVKIEYNEVTLQTKIMINNEPFDTSEINNVKMEVWLLPFSEHKVQWKGIFKELSAVMQTEKYTIKFSGSTKFMSLLMATRPKTVNIILDSFLISSEFFLRYQELDLYYQDFKRTDRNIAWERIYRNIAREIKSGLDYLKRKHEKIFPVSVMALTDVPGVLGVDSPCIANKLEEIFDVIKDIYESWDSPRANVYRHDNGLSFYEGFAIKIFN